MNNIKRWLVTDKEGYTLKLYYSTYEECKANNPNCNIQECFDYKYLETIDKILEQAKLNHIDYKGRKIYKLHIYDGFVLFRLLEHKEETGLYRLDCIQYQQWNNKRNINPITWDICDIAKFYNKYINFKPMTFSVYAFRKYGQPKMKKPKELNKISAFSIDFIPKKCKCQCFIKDDDLWIKHRDFFSETFKPKTEDIGKPLEYIVEKYFNQDRHFKSFIYPDAWGSVILRNEAWVIFNNIMPRIQLTDEKHLSLEMLHEFSKYHKVADTYFVGTEWTFFFERISKQLYEMKNSS